jgi:hypothetical protein
MPSAMPVTSVPAGATPACGHGARRMPGAPARSQAIPASATAA